MAVDAFYRPVRKARRISPTPMAVPQVGNGPSMLRIELRGRDVHRFLPHPCSQSTPGPRRLIALVEARFTDHPAIGTSRRSLRPCRDAEAQDWAIRTCMHEFGTYEGCDDLHPSFPVPHAHLRLAEHASLAPWSSAFRRHRSGHPPGTQGGIHPASSGGVSSFTMCTYERMDSICIWWTTLAPSGDGGWSFGSKAKGLPAHRSHPPTI